MRKRSASKFPCQQHLRDYLREVFVYHILFLHFNGAAPLFDECGECPNCNRNKVLDTNETSSSDVRVWIITEPLALIFFDGETIFIFSKSSPVRSRCTAQPTATANKPKPKWQL